MEQKYSFLSAPTVIFLVMNNSGAANHQVMKGPETISSGISSLVGAINEKVGVINSITTDVNYSLGGYKSREGHATNDGKDLTPSNLTEVLIQINNRLASIIDVVGENRNIIQG